MSVERSCSLITHCSQLLQRRRDFLPIWSCSVWGLPCPLHYWDGGALLPHLFTLTRTLPPGRYIFCGTFRQSALTPISRTLSGTLLCGVRTFLPRRSTRQGRPSGPAAYTMYYIRSFLRQHGCGIPSYDRQARARMPMTTNTDLWRHGRLARAISCYKFGAS